MLGGGIWILLWIAAAIWAIQAFYMAAMGYDDNTYQPISKRRRISYLIRAMLVMAILAAFPAISRHISWMQSEVVTTERTIVSLPVSSNDSDSLVIALVTRNGQEEYIVAVDQGAWQQQRIIPKHRTDIETSNSQQAKLIIYDCNLSQLQRIWQFGCGTLFDLGFQTEYRLILPFDYQTLVNPLRD